MHQFVWASAKTWLVPFATGVMPSKYWKRMQHGSLREDASWREERVPSPLNKFTLNCLQSEGSQNAPTNFGSKLFKQQAGIRLEDPAVAITLNLLSPCYATAWDFTFTTRSVEFSVDDLFFALCDYRDSLSTTADSSLKRHYLHSVDVYRASCQDWNAVWGRTISSHLALE